MQSNKTSKQTRKNADQVTAAVPETGIATDATITKPRNSRSSRTKKSELAEAAPVKHHHKTTSPVVVSTPTAAAAETAAYLASKTRESVASNNPPLSSGPTLAASPERIAERAYSYWVARGYAPGSPEEDWLRAERELTATP